MAFSLKRLGRCFNAHFGEEVVYRPAGGVPRRVTGVANRENAPESIIFEVDNDPATGIASQEIDHHRDQIEIPLVVGGDVSLRYIAFPFPNQDEGRIQLDLRRMFRMTVTRPTDTTAAGATERTYSAHLVGVPCRWDRASGDEAERFGAERMKRRWVGIVKTSADVRRGDKCVFTDEITSRTVYVIDAIDLQGEMRQLEAEEVT